MDIKVFKYFRESFYVTKNSNRFGHDSKLGTLESLRMWRIKTFKNSRLRIAFETFTRPRLTIRKSVVAIETSTSTSSFNANFPKCNGASRICAPSRGCISTVTEATKEKRAEGAIASCFRENSLLRLSASWYLWIPRLKARRWLACGDRARSKLIISTERPDNL